MAMAYRYAVLITLVSTGCVAGLGPDWEYDLADFTDRRLSVDLFSFGLDDDDERYDLSLSFDANEYEDGCPSMSDNVIAAFNGVGMPVETGGLDPLLDLDGCSKPEVWYEFDVAEIPVRDLTEIALVDGSDLIRLELEHFLSERSVSIPSHPGHELRVGEEVVLEWQPANEPFDAGRGYVAIHPGDDRAALVLRGDDLIVDGNNIRFTMPALEMDQLGPGTLRVTNWVQPTVVSCEGATCIVESVTISREVAIDIRV